VSARIYLLFEAKWGFDKAQLWPISQKSQAGASPNAFYGHGSESQFVDFFSFSSI